MNELKCSDCLKPITDFEEYYEVQMEIEGNLGYMTFHSECWPDAVKKMEMIGMEVPPIQRILFG